MNGDSSFLEKVINCNKSSFFTYDPERERRYWKSTSSTVQNKYGGAHLISKQWSFWYRGIIRIEYHKVKQLTKNTTKVSEYLWWAEQMKPTWFVDKPVHGFLLEQWTCTQWIFYQDVCGTAGNPWSCRVNFLNPKSSQLLFRKKFATKKKQ